MPDDLEILRQHIALKKLKAHIAAKKAKPVASGLDQANVGYGAQLSGTMEKVRNNPDPVVGTALRAAGETLYNTGRVVAQSPFNPPALNAVTALAPEKTEYTQKAEAARESQTVGQNAVSDLIQLAPYLMVRGAPFVATAGEQVVKDPKVLWEMLKDVGRSAVDVARVGQPLPPPELVDKVSKRLIPTLTNVMLPLGMAGHVAGKFGKKGKIAEKEILRGLQEQKGQEAEGQKAQAVPEIAQAEGEVTAQGTEAVGKQPWEMTRDELESKYTKAGSVVDGRRVRSEIPNMASIESSVENSTVLPGIYEIPLSEFEGGLTGKHYSVSGNKRIAELADEISINKEINPLIVVIDKDGPYILEGSTRAEALYKSGAKSFPAKIVLDEGSFYDAAKRAVDEGRPVPPEVLADYPDLAAKYPIPGTVVPEKGTSVPKSESVGTGKGVEPPKPPSEPTTLGFLGAGDMEMLFGKKKKGEKVPKPPVVPVETRDRINIERYEITPEARIKLDEAVQVANKGIAKNKGEVLGHGEVIADAAKAEMLQKVLTRDETKAALGAFKKLDEHMAALAEKEAGTKGITKEFLDALETVSAFGTDAGRRLEFQKAGTEAILSKLPEGDRIKIEFAKKLQKLGNSAESIVDAFKDVDWNNANQVTKAYRQLVPETFWDQLKEFRYGNMLSSPGTHIVNAVSNAIQGLVLRPAERVTMGLADAVASSVTGKHRQYYVRQTPEYYRGAFKAMPKAIGDAIATIQGKKFGDRPDIGRLGTTTKWLAPWRGVLRTLEAADVFARTMVKAGETKALEYTNKRGGKQLTPDQIKAQAEYTSREATYRPTDDKTINQGHLGNAIDDFTRGIYSLRRMKIGKNFEPLSWVIPFVETPMKIFKMGLQYTPGGYGFMPGSQMKMTQFARATIGSTVTLGAAYLAFEGHSTWAAPRGKKERDAFYAAGKKPYSITIPGVGQIQYNRLGPIGYPLALAAAAQYYWQEDKNASTNSKLEKTGNVVAAMGKFFSDQTYMQGIGDIVGAIGGNKSQIADIATNYPKQVIPFESFMRWVNQATDKYYREADRGLSLNAIKESFMKEVPGLSHKLPAYAGEKKAPFAMATFPFWAPEAGPVKEPPKKQKKQKKQKERKRQP